jgi:hypothetical protein
VGLVTALLACLLLICSCAPGDGLREMDAIELSLRNALGSAQAALEESDAASLRSQGDALIALRLRLERLRVRPASEAMRAALGAALDGCIDGAQTGSKGLEDMRAAEAVRDSLQKARPAAADPDMTPAVRLLKDSAVSLEQCRASLGKAAEALARAHEERARFVEAQ